MYKIQEYTFCKNTNKKTENEHIGMFASVGEGEWEWIF